MEERGYVLRRKNRAGEDEYIPVHIFTVEAYRCGLRAGDRLMLRRELLAVIRRARSAVWTVLTGSPTHGQDQLVRADIGPQLCWPHGHQG
jgi:hypothetical protein